jgi:hypothetical protein
VMLRLIVGGMRSRELLCQWWIWGMIGKVTVPNDFEY